MTLNADQARRLECTHGTAADAWADSTGAGSAHAMELHVALLLTDEDGLVTYADMQCCKLTGGLARGQPWAQMVAHEDHERVSAGWAESRDNRLPFCAEFRVRSAGRPRWVRACGVYAMDVFDDGSCGWTWHLMDCTLEHRLSEAVTTLPPVQACHDDRGGAAVQAIRALQCATDGLAVIDTHRIVLCNDSWARMHVDQVARPGGIVWEQLYDEESALRIRGYMEWPSEQRSWRARVSSRRGDGAMQPAIVQLTRTSGAEVIVVESTSA